MNTEKFYIEVTYGSPEQVGSFDRLLNLLMMRQARHKDNEILIMPIEEEETEEIVAYIDEEILE